MTQEHDPHATGAARRPDQAGDGERGAVLLIVSISMLALMIVAALVVDLGLLQRDRRAIQLAADNAATAAIGSLDPFVGGTAVAACEVAWSYVKLGLPDDALTTPSCTPFATACDPATPRQVSASDEGYTVRVTHPVVDGSPLLAGQPANADFDGTPCQRVAVEITRRRDHRFAPVAGFTDGQTSVDAVARINVGLGGGELVPLLVLDPIGCDSLYTSGQGGIEILPNGSTPGYIVVDSDGTRSGNASPGCANSNAYTIDAQGNQNGFIRALPTADGAPGAILSYALWTSTAAKSYDPNDLAGSPARLSPQPRAFTSRVTRAPVDWRYNCKASYPDHLGIPIAGCVTAPAPHIDDLVAQLSGTGVPAGYQVYPRPGIDPLSGLPLFPDDTCTTQSSTPPITLPAGNWFVDCAAFNVSSAVTFRGGNVVFRGPVTVDSATGNLTVNHDATADSIVYVRDGDFVKKAQATLTMNRTFVYLTPRTLNNGAIIGAIDLGGGSGTVTWTSPAGGKFEDLSLWAEAATLHSLAGQSNWLLEGTLFTPNANPFRLTGQGGISQMRAQFLTRRLEVAGQGTVQMMPEPERITPLPARAFSLIR